MGLGKDTAWWLFLQITLLAGPGCMLMGTARRGRRRVPHDLALGVGQALEPGEDPLPGAVPLPSAKQVVDPAPRSILGGDASPRIPLRTRNRMPSTSCRRGQTGGRPAFVPFRYQRRSAAHCSSVRSPRPMSRYRSSLKIHFRCAAWSLSLADFAGSDGGLARRSAALSSFADAPRGRPPPLAPRRTRPRSSAPARLPSDSSLIRRTGLSVPGRPVRAVPRLLGRRPPRAPPSRPSPQRPLRSRRARPPCPPPARRPPLHRRSPRRSPS